MSDYPRSGDYGGGYLKVTRHARTAVTITGFALVLPLIIAQVSQAQVEGYKYKNRIAYQTEPQMGWLYTAQTPATPFDAQYVVPSVNQSQQDGYKYPAKPARNTEFQDGWRYTGSLPFDPTVTTAPSEQLTESFRLPTKSKWTLAEPPSLGWLSNLSALWSAATPEESQRPQRKSLVAGDQPNTGWLSNLFTLWPGETQQSPDRVRTTKARVAVDQPDTGWIAASLTPFDPQSLPHSDDTRLSERYKKVPQTDQPSQAWIFSAVPEAPAFDPQLFQNSTGELTPKNKALSFRYPMLSSGFSTDVWTIEKFQNNYSDRTPARKGRPVQFDFHDTNAWISSVTPPPPFDPSLINWRIDSGRTPQRAALTDLHITPQRTQALLYNIPILAGVWAQGVNDEAMHRGRIYLRPQIDQPDQSWIFTSVPPFDAFLVIHSEMPLRMADRHKLDTRWAQYYNDMAWLHDVLGLPDPPASSGAGIRRRLTIMGAGH